MYINIFAYVCYQWISLHCKVQTQIMLLRMGMHIKYINKSNQNQIKSNNERSERGFTKTVTPITGGRKVWNYTFNWYWWTAYRFNNMSVMMILYTKCNTMREEMENQYIRYNIWSTGYISCCEEAIPKKSAPLLLLISRIILTACNIYAIQDNLK